jgi:MFS family permease
MWTELKEGLRFVFGNPNLRAQAGCTATSNLFSSLAFAIFLVFAIRELQLSAGVIGLIFPIGAAGSLVAAVTAMRISNRFGIGPTTIAVGALWGPAFLVVGLAPEGNAAIPLLIAALLVAAFSGVVYNIVQVSYRQAICPPRLQGRMNSVMRFLVWGTIPIGTLAGGALGSWVGLRETIIVGGIGSTLAVLWIIFSPQRHLREMPEPIEDVPRPEELGAALPLAADPLHTAEGV